MKVYLLSGLEKISEHDKNNIQIDYDFNSIDLKIREFKGKNYRFRLEPLHRDIDVGACTMQIKTNSITITLKKREGTKHWSDILQKKEAKKESKASEQETTDPNASLMNLMKDLYNNGNDEMKKTIAESWGKAHQK